MPFLTINGHTFKVANGSSRRGIKSMGKRSRAYRGQMRNSTRGQRRQLTFRACFQDYEYAETMINVINGDGHLVRFVDGWDASTGLQPEIGNLDLCRFDRVTAGPFAGFQAGSFVSEVDLELFVFDAQLCDEWTIHVWIKVDIAAWQVMTIRDDGVMYLDGVRSDANWNASQGNYSQQVRDGRLVISGSGSDLTRLRHLAILPYRAHTSFIESWHAATKPWGSIPALRVEGDALASDHEFFFGEVSGVTYVGKPESISPFGWVNNAQIVEFKLIEIPSGFVADDVQQSQGTSP